MFTPHPNLAPEVNAAIADSELQGGAWVKDLPVGKTLKVTTRNTVYFIDRVAEGPEGLTIQGHPRYCPESEPVHILGSTFGGSMLKVGFVGRGMHLEFCLTNNQDFRGSTITSQIQEVEEI